LRPFGAGIIDGGYPNIKSLLAEIKTGVQNTPDKVISSYDAKNDVCALRPMYCRLVRRTTFAEHMLHLSSQGIVDPFAQMLASRHHQSPSNAELQCPRAHG
jgi:hypothetical protein